MASKSKHDYSFRGRPDFNRIIRELPTARAILVELAGSDFILLWRVTESECKRMGVPFCERTPAVEALVDVHGKPTWCATMRHIGDNLVPGWSWMFVASCADAIGQVERLRQMRSERGAVRVTRLM